jgi:hypothetical protein
MRSPTDPDRGPRRRSRGDLSSDLDLLRPLVPSSWHPVAAPADTAMEMTRPWTSQNDVHRRLEISHRTRDSHIPTAASCLRRMKNDEENDNTPYRWTPALE